MASCKFVNTKLLPMKAVMFGWFGASACALPYMTVHMKELGLTVEETAVVYTLLPITQALSSPIAGFIADRLGRYRNVLLVSILMTIIFATALLYVPPVATNDFQNSLVVSFMCTSTEAYDIQCNNVANQNFSKLFCHIQCNNSNSTNNSWDVSSTTKALLQDLCSLNGTAFGYRRDTGIPICNVFASSASSACNVTCHKENTLMDLSLEKINSNRRLTFYLYAILRILYNIFSAIGFTLVNASALALTETEAKMGEYGRQRLWAMLAMAVFSPLAGVLVDVLSTDTVTNYAPAFHTHNVLALLTCIAVWKLDFEMEDAPSSYMETLKNFWLIIKNPSISFLLLIVFWLGTMWGFLESFLFWFMHELNSPTYILGLTITAGSLIGIPFLYYARAIVTKFGYANILSMAVFTYMVRCVGCSFLQDPWWIMPFECLEIFTYHLMWVAAATYATHLSPSGLLATIQGFIEALHYGVGQGSGSLLGGVLMSKFGTRATFQLMGGISGVVAVLYALLHFFWLRKETVQTISRKASIKSFSSQKPERKASSLSYHENNGTNMLPRLQGSVFQEVML